MTQLTNKITRTISWGDLTNSNKQQPPTLILVSNQLTTSIKKIYNHANQHFITKIQNLRNKLVKNTNISPIQLLNS